MPGTERRACSSSTKVFHAARNGRGNAVTMTVSSMSETIPNRTLASTTKIGAVTAVPPSTTRRISCQPEDRPTSTRTSITPPRSDRIATWVPSTMTDDRGVPHRDAGEAAPAADAAEPIGRIRLGQHDAAEHADPAIAPVSRERDDHRNEPTTTSGALPEAVDPVVDAGGEMLFAAGRSRPVVVFSGPATRPVCHARPEVPPGPSGARIGTEPA